MKVYTAIFLQAWIVKSYTWIFFSVTFRFGFKGNDLWQAALKGDVKKVDKLVKTGADITFKKDNKRMINMVRELEQSNASDPAKLYYYRQIKLMIETKLNLSVCLLNGVLK